MNLALMQGFADALPKEEAFMSNSGTNAISPAVLSIKLAMRRLWSDQVIWTRDYVVAAIAGSADTEAVAGRLLRNQDHIGNAIVPFYGDDAGKALTDLLKQHIMIVVELVDAAKASNQRSSPTPTNVGTVTLLTSLRS